VLIRFAVENFRSIRDRQEITLVASSLKDLDQGKIPVKSLGLDLLRVLAIYGANASGKTNVLRALEYMARAVISSQRHWTPSGPIPIQPFRLDPASAGRPSTFEIDIVLEGTRYNYGFQVTSARVLSEWLLAYPNGKKQTWFRRAADRETEFQFGKYLLGENRAIQNLTRTNSLYLSAAAQNGHQQLLPIFNWFANQVDVVNPARRDVLRLSAVRMCDNPAGRATLLRFLSAADLGIVDVDVKERDMDEKFTNAFRIFFTSITDSEPPPDSIPPMPDIHLRHQAVKGKPPIALEFEEESDGTKALFSLAAPVFHALSTGSLLCIDELDSSLHPILALQVVKTFAQPSTNPLNAQLIFNTHDTNLLDTDVLRRDQVWFTEKDQTGATHIYPLSDFKPRRQENLERGYLQGRYGAIPIPGRLLAIGTDGQ
jgi:uncharacterized protein